MIKENGHPIIQSFQCVESRSLEEERWKMYDSLHSEISECSAFISHDSLGKSAQRSSSKLVRRFGSADSWPNAPQQGEIRREGARSIESKIGAARSGFFGADTKEE